MALSSRKRLVGHDYGRVCTMMFPWDHYILNISSDLEIWNGIPTGDLTFLLRRNDKKSRVWAYHYEFGWWDPLKLQWVNNL